MAKRITLLDEYRGVAIIAMILFHAYYDIAVLLPLPAGSLSHPAVSIASNLIGGSFTLISGICSVFSKSNIRRGFICLFFALMITVVTSVFMPSERIIFGVLHMLGLSMVIYGVLQKLLSKIPCVLGGVVFICLFIITFKLSSGYLLLGTYKYYLPQSFYTTAYLFPFGFRGPGFFSADYYPLFPWLFLFMAGSYLGNWLSKANLPDFFYRKKSPVLVWMGKHSLLLYIVHQPLLYGFFYCFFTLWVFAFTS